MKFSLVVAIRDTPHEREFTKRSLRASSDLQPAETIIGIDEPASRDFLDIINKSASKHRAPRIIRVDHSDEWNMHLAHVIDECYKATTHQKILTYNIDSILQRRILDGYALVGSQTPLIMYQEKRPIKKHRDIMTGIIYRLNQIITTPDTGTYWLHKPAYFDCMDSIEFRKIYNGYDTFLIAQIRAVVKHIVAKSIVGAHNLDYSNNDIPWRQFECGVWYGANPDKIVGHFAGRPEFKIRLKSLLLDMPYLYAGFKWACNNPDHPTVKNAQTKTFIEFGHQGSKPVEGILNWEEIGKLGVGHV